MAGERDVTVERARELARELAPATDFELVPVCGCQEVTHGVPP